MNYNGPLSLQMTNLFQSSIDSLFALACATNKPMHDDDEEEERKNVEGGGGYWPYMTHELGSC